jgi:hypothetical protein
LKLIQTSDSQACEILEWQPEEAIILARPRLNAFFETVHPMLQVITTELGAMDPASIR